MRSKYWVLMIIITLFVSYWAVLAKGQSQSASDDKQGSAEYIDPSKDGQGSDLSRYRLNQPSSMEKQWRDYRDFLEHRNLMRSPNNPESDLEYMLREFF